MTAFKRIAHGEAEKEGGRRGFKHSTRVLPGLLWSTPILNLEQPLTSFKRSRLRRFHSMLLLPLCSICCPLVALAVHGT